MIKLIKNSLSEINLTEYSTNRPVNSFALSGSILNFRNNPFFSNLFRVIVVVVVKSQILLIWVIIKLTFPTFTCFIHFTQRPLKEMLLAKSSFIHYLQILIESGAVENFRTSWTASKLPSRFRWKLKDFRWLWTVCVCVCVAISWKFHLWSWPWVLENFAISYEIFSIYCLPRIPEYSLFPPDVLGNFSFWAWSN